MKGERVAIVGGSAGIGLALARRAKELGAEVILGARNRENLERAAAALEVSCAVVDTMDEEGVRGFFRDVGPVDHVATPGCTVRLGSLKSTASADILFTLQNKFLGQALCAKHAEVKSGGSITFFSGMLALRPGPWPLLGAVNAAVETLTRGLAVEWAPVRINAVSPGLIRHTEAFAAMTESQRETMFAETAGKLPLGRVGEPEDPAHAAIFLMRSKFITGQVLCVDGGATVV